MSIPATEALPSVCARYPALDGRPARPLGTGLINDTFLIDGRDGPVVLQRVHTIFGPRVHEDIEAVTAHLAARGLLTPRLVRAEDDARYVTDTHGRVWRAMTYVHGVALDKADSPARIRAAGALVARWHGALRDFRYDYAHVRPGVHDTPRHLSTLREALAAHASHRLHSAVSSLAEPLLHAASSLSDLSSLEPTHAHGDLKLSNLLFDARSGEGLCLVDLDTVGKMPWAFELGDALRSWCNPHGEDVTEAAVDRALFAAALEGYASALPDPLRGQDLERLARWAAEGLATIALELSARFLADALEERYFGFDARRFAARGEHNLVRGRGQWSLARDAITHREELEAIARRALAREGPSTRDPAP